MATPPVPKISNGDVLRQSKAKAAAKKSSLKPLKSNITNKVKSARSTKSASAGADESEDDESDSSAIGEHSISDDDADVFALSNGRQQSIKGAERRSAGPQSKDEDTMMNDDEMQAVAGAEQSTDDDDQYADVEDISDSEESDGEGDTNAKKILRSAENDLIDEYERSEQRKAANGVTDAINDMALEDDEARDIALAQELSLQDANPHMDFNFEVNMDDDPFVGLAGDDSIYKAMWDEAEMAMWRRPGPGSPKLRGNASNGAQKRVRFEENHDTFSRESSPASSEEDANEAFPDLFASQDDPVIKRHLALDVDDDNGLLPYDWGDLESCYDFDGDEEDLAFQLDEADDTDESEDDSDDSDSDDGGDTTDEETAEEQKAKLQERRAAVAKMKGMPVTPTPNRAAARTPSTPSTTRPATPKTGRGPQMGTFIKDPTRATITNDSVAKRTRIEPPTNPPEKDRAFWENAKRANLRASGSRRGSGITAPSPGSDSMPDRPFTAQCTLGTMFNGNLDLLRNNEATDSMPAFQAPTPSTQQLSFTATTATEDSEDDYADVNMQDFLDLSESDSENERPVSAHVDSPSEIEIYGSSQTLGMANSSPGLLNHFELNRGLVGSFRRNQQSTKHFSSLASHPAKRASAHEYNALQKGRRGAANTPMTPARKKRASQDLSHMSSGVRKSISSPLAARRPRSRGNSVASKNPAGLYDTLTQSPF